MLKTPDELVQAVKRQFVVTLRESTQVYLKRNLAMPMLVLASGLALGLLKGGVWWAVPCIGAISAVGAVLWLPYRKVPELHVSMRGIEWDNNSYTWQELDAIGASSDPNQFLPDWIFVKTTEGQVVSLESTFGCKKEILRDGLNQLLVDNHDDSSRAQYDAHLEQQRGVNADISTLRFSRPTGPDDALEQVRVLIGQYYCPGCDTTTEVSDQLLTTAALDPFSFPLDYTTCAGCGDTPMQEVVLVNGQNLKEAFEDMQKKTSMKAQLGRLFLFSVFLTPVGAGVGLTIAFVIQVAKNAWLLAMLGAGAGFILGIVLSLLLFKSVRRRGYLW